MRRLATTTVATVMLLGLVPGPAPRAAFPGKNGLIAYSAEARGGLDIFVSNADGSHARNITRTRKIDEFSPAFAPGGKTVAFAVAARNGSSDIALIRVDGTDKRLVTDTPELGESSPTFSPDGDTIAFIAADESGSNNVWTVPVAGGAAPAQLTTTGDVAPLGLSWKPDGSSIAYPRLRVGVGYAIDLYEVPAAGGDPAILVAAEDGMEARDPDFAPDGTTLAYLLGEQLGRRSTHVAAAEGEAQEIDPRSGHDHFALAWAPTGGRILVYDKTRRGGAIVTYDPGAGDRKRVRWEDALELAWGRCRRSCAITTKQPTDTVVRRAEPAPDGIVVDFEVFARHAGSKVVVILERKAGGRWHEVARYLVPLGRAGLTSTFITERPKAGSCRVVVRFRGDDDHKPSRARRGLACRNAG